jgi:uncharacterized SAM-binding protein YcdF (DUF218 family)
MPPLYVRLALSRFLDPAVLIVVAWLVGLLLTRMPRSAAGGERAARRSTRAGRTLLWTSWAMLWALSAPFVSGRLTAAVEMRGPDLPAALAGADPTRTALVVLAGGLRTYDRSMPPRERLDSATQSRVLGAARLYHTFGFGTVVLSGAPAAESEAMADLITALGVPEARLVRESASMNTRENAEYGARVIRERGVEAVVLATSATHLRRAVREFERAGVHVIPAAVDVVGPSRFGVDQLLPAATALGRSHAALHEVLGYLKP